MDDAMGGSGGEQEYDPFDQVTSGRSLADIMYSSLEAGKDAAISGAVDAFNQSKVGKDAKRQIVVAYLKRLAVNPITWAIVGVSVVVLLVLAFRK